MAPFRFFAVKVACLLPEFLKKESSNNYIMNFLMKKVNINFFPRFSFNILVSQIMKKSITPSRIKE